jgi:hypothetical protein
MTYEEAGVADKRSFLIGKIIGAHFVVSPSYSTSCTKLTATQMASNAARDLISINEHLEKRFEEGEKLVELCNGFKDGTVPDLSAVQELILQVLMVVRQDSEYLNAQTKIYEKDFKESGAKLADMQKKSE